jgi:hypothetical protein
MEGGSFNLGNLIRLNRIHISNMSTFESRTGRLSCKAQDLFYFLTDIRNFEQFIPKDKLHNIRIDKDSCTFNISMLGEVYIHIKETAQYSKVVFSGKALMVNEFSLEVKFHDTDHGNSEARLLFLAALNPMLKIIASDPIKKFLETIITEMEKFKGWKEIREDTQTP